MRCYLMRNGHIAAVEVLFGLLPKKKRRQKLHMPCFQSANTFSKASSCGITLVF